MKQMHHGVSIVFLQSSSAMVVIFTRKKRLKRVNLFPFQVVTNLHYKNSQYQMRDTIVEKILKGLDEKMGLFCRIDKKKL